MRELDIRRALRRRLTETFGSDPTVLILDELGVCRGTVRADMAVVNGSLKGFEIKSDQDNLNRLPSQASAYNKVFDTLTIVVGARHLQQVEATVPGWWGMLLVDANGEEPPLLRAVRPEGSNHEIDSSALAQLLWRDEALAVLERNGLEAGLRSKPRRYLWDALARSFTLVELRELVRTQLKARQGWRSGSQRMRGGATFLPSARLSSCPDPPERLRTR